ncbi:hypothetical protein NP233_g11776 [Leucocoprinus birnbaumii]|uniref:ATP-citrate synthase citrate-binding domain-containing protein n=1 Tax=Leucocoprinus birnbaumii TaxID=56174 RepID=A0AAD5VGH7_9AGAR|nr:hypothetical protein NP233_g11776 [Leucocoprinus birnbaumii]
MAALSSRASARNRTTDQPVVMPSSFGSVEKVGMQFGSTRQPKIALGRLDNVSCRKKRPGTPSRLNDDLQQQLLLLALAEAPSSVGVAKLDQTAESICGPKWAIARDFSVYESGDATTSMGSKVSADRGPPMVWSTPFGRDLTKEEAYIQKLDGSTGAFLKLTVLNAEGHIWTMVAGGGASVVYSDAIAAHGYAHELANYGEYSGAPTEGQTHEYAKTIIDLITRGAPCPDGKILTIGGGIANFTNVAATFKGIIRALKEYKN